MISNGNTHIERSGLADLLAFAVFPGDSGHEKPSPAMFEFAMRKAGCAAEELLHVGDSLADDVAGANASGVTSVWLNRTGAPNETGVTPDYEIADLRELVGLLDSA